MKKISVLVVDDSAVIRRLLTDVLAGDPEIDVIGHAANGRIALSLISQLKPDVVTLDVEMPEMDGIETLRAIRSQHRQLRTIMFSTLTERGAEATIEALSLGASDYVTKPSNVGNVQIAKDRIREQLVPKVKHLCGRAPAGTDLARPIAFSEHVSKRSMLQTRPIDIVAIGTSTGGPNALAQIIPSIPAEFPVPIVVVQHMPPTFTRFLAQRLDGVSAIDVSEAEAGSELQPGGAWIAAGGYHMELERRGTAVRVLNTSRPPENSCRPSVDVLFRSVATAFRGNVLAIVLTGMGRDGLEGCRELRNSGAHIVVQDEASSIVWGMPGVVATSNLADEILPLAELAPRIVNLVKESRTVLGQGRVVLS